MSDDKVLGYDGLHYCPYCGADMTSEDLLATGFCPCPGAVAVLQAVWIKRELELQSAN